MAKTTIQLDETTAERLYDLKGRGDSYDNVIWRLLEAYDDA